MATYSPDSVSRDPAEGSPEGLCDPLAALRDLARRRGLREFRVVSADGGERPVAGYLPTRPGPTFYVTRALVRLLGPAELRVAFAHELGHHERRHCAKALVASTVRKLSALAVTAGALAAGQPAYPAEWELTHVAPLVLLTWYLAYLAVTPLLLAYERHQEMQAHRRALEITGDPEAYVSAMRKIAAATGCDREPSWWETWLCTPSPGLSEVLGLAEPSAARRGPRGAP